MYDVSQALVTISGNGSRLIGSDHAWPSKAFIEFGGRPALFWTLLSLKHAGIRDIVLASDRPALYGQAKEAAAAAGFSKEHWTFFADAGLGVHGIPFHARKLLRHRFLFDAGHSMTPTYHYLRLKSIVSNRVGYSVFVAKGANASRTRVKFKTDPGWPVELSENSEWVVALPYVLSHKWATSTPGAQFDIRKIVDNDNRSGIAEFVPANFEPEFDLDEELLRVRRDFVRTGIGRHILSSLGYHCCDEAVRDC